MDPLIKAQPDKMSPKTEEHLLFHCFCKKTDLEVYKFVNIVDIVASVMKGVFSFCMFVHNIFLNLVLFGISFLLLLISMTGLILYVKSNGNFGTKLHIWYSWFRLVLVIASFIVICYGLILCIFNSMQTTSERDYSIQVFWAVVLVVLYVPFELLNFYWSFLFLKVIKCQFLVANE